MEEGRKRDKRDAEEGWRRDGRGMEEEQRGGM